MPYILRFSEGGQEKKVEVHQQELILGRSPDCGLILAQPGISRHHCKIIQNGDKVAIEDLHSKNGTRVNNIYVTREELGPSAEILVAEFLVRFERDGAASSRQSQTEEMVLLSEDKQLHEEAGTIIREANEVQDILAKIEKEQQATPIQNVTDDVTRIRTVVIEVAKALIAVKSVDEIIQKLMGLIFENLPADRGCLMLRNEDGVLQTHVVKHRDPGEKDAINISKTIANKALNDKMAILTTDAQVDPRFSAGESIRFLGIKSAMCVPLFHKKKTIGIIYLDSPTSAAIFGPTDLDLLTALANFAAVGIEQAQLNEKVLRETSIRQRLERYHSPSIVDRILKNLGGNTQQAEEFHLNAEERDVTVLFTDIVGFTPMSGRMAPNRIAKLLNEYFSEMTEVIFQYEGTLDKYIGDAIMAIFGAPNLMEDHAYRAVCTAMDMMDRLHALNKTRDEESQFSIRIGINSGRAVAGDIGSIKRMEYTVLGNTVNIASRIESTACKPNTVVVGESTYKLVADHFVCEAIGPIRLKGIAEEAHVYRIIKRK